MCIVLRQRNAVISIIGLIILAGFIVLCVLFGNITTDEVPEIEMSTVADRLMSVWKDDVLVDEFVEFDTIVKSYYGSLTEPLDRSLAIFNICENNELIVFLSEYGVCMGFTIDDEYVYHEGTAIFEIGEMTDGILTLLPVYTEDVQSDVQRIIAKGEAETFIADNN